MTPDDVIKLIDRKEVVDLALALAESEQQALARFGYPAASAHPAHPAVAWFRDQLHARMGALALHRPPLGS